MRRTLATLLLSSALLVGCSKKDDAFLKAEAPSDPLAFRTFLLKNMPEEMEKTYCNCCKKSLALCYRETLSGQGPRCPDT